MAKLHALVVGVSNYISENITNLSFCKNDIMAVSRALIFGLKAEPENILVCGNNGMVYRDSFVSSLIKLLSDVSFDDTIVFYFSGHGGSCNGKHHLMLSDMPITTEEIISILDNAPTKNKIICLDACMSGEFKVDQCSVFSINDTVDDFAGKGYAVFASSSANQSSYSHPEKPISLFTSFFCDALMDKYIIRKGKRSLYDIKKLLFLYLDIWNRRNPDIQQTPIFRANMGGTIFFDAEEYKPYCRTKIYEELSDYIIYAVEPIHNSIAKRYVVKIVLKKPLEFNEIAVINHEIVEKVKKLEVYKSIRSQERWQGYNANLIFCYFGFDEEDIINANYICRTTWADNSQDKTWWYRLGENDIIIEDIHFNINLYYDFLKSFNEINTSDVDTLINRTKEILTHLISLSEKVIMIYNEFLNHTKNEKEFINELEPILPIIEKYYFLETSLPIAPKELHEWSQCCSSLAATIHDFTFFYNKKYLASRTPENRIDCMDITVEKYYKNIEALRNAEKVLSY